MQPIIFSDFNCLQLISLIVLEITINYIGKEYVKAVYCHPAYLTSMQSWAGLEETQAGIKIARRNINNLRYADDTTLMAENEEELRAS